MFSVRSTKFLFVLALAFLGAANARAQVADIRERLLTTAREIAQLGLPYKFGATQIGQGGLDCSGFVQLVFQRAWNLTLPDEAWRQFSFARQHGQAWDALSQDWSPQKLQPGDLIFFTGTYHSRHPSPITHVMIYAGNGQMMGAQSRGRCLERIGAGVGFYAFTPLRPRGNPSLGLDVYRNRMTLYGYARLAPPTEFIGHMEKVSLP